ncbi:MAG: redoxin domain-containing protein, partial [Woeseiaceae bacterium]|nr:redoxin domain-containing protein [Woeseiaceae bacterium]
LFVRGNWCPFCSRQVASLTESYRRINELGARLILVTPKPLETTRRVAEFFDFDFEFWLDESLAAGRQLGLVQEGGVPASHRSEYGDDTLWPAAVVTDAEGIIRDAVVSKVIADRPSPHRFVRTLERMRSEG